MTTRSAALAAFDTDSDLARARKRLGAALPDKGWIADYLHAVVPLTDAPVEFSLASGLCALATALGNTVWYETWGQKVYPHLWVVLVAPSSFWRKSTAINMAERILRQADPTRLLPSDFSREKFLEEMSARPVGMLSLKEFGGFLAAIGRDYMTGTRELLTELYDGPDEYSRALKSKTIVIKRPALTMVAATTLDWLEARITEGDLRGGFLGRFLFVRASEKASPKGLTMGLDYQTEAGLRDGLRDLMKETPSAVTFTPAARELLEAWIEGWEDEVTATHHASDLSGFAVRLQTYALKLAMVYQASRACWGHESLIAIDEQSVGSAIACCRVMWQNVAGIVDEDIAIGKDAQQIRRLKQLVGNGEGIKKSDALRLMHLKARDFDGILDTLVRSGEVLDERRTSQDVDPNAPVNRGLQWLRVHRNGSDRSHDSHHERSQRTNANARDTSAREPAKADVSRGDPSGPDLSTKNTTIHTSHTHSSSDIDTAYAGAGEIDPDEAPWPDVVAESEPSDDAAPDLNFG